MIALHYNTSLTCFSIIKLLIFIFKLTIKMYFILCILLYKILIVSTIYNIIYMQCIIMIFRSKFKLYYSILYTINHLGMGTISFV